MYTSIKTIVSLSAKLLRQYKPGDQKTVGLLMSKRKRVIISKLWRIPWTCLVLVTEISLRFELYVRYRH